MANNRKLEPRGKDPITGERKEHFEGGKTSGDLMYYAHQLIFLEALRTNKVPRYLFRAWHQGNGGGSIANINTIATIVPHAFMPKVNIKNASKLPSFYKMPEGGLHRMATSHYLTRDTVSGFSSWAASLHLVLCYATYLSNHQKSAMHAVVMDTHELEEEVLVWHVPHPLMAGSMSVSPLDAFSVVDIAPQAFTTFIRTAYLRCFRR